MAVQISEILYSSVYLLSAATLALLIGGGVPTMASSNIEATPSNASYEVELINDLEDTNDVQIYADTSDVSFNIRIPAQVVLARDYENGGYSGKYTVYAENNNASEDCIEVYPATRTLELSTTGKDPVTAYIEQEDTLFNSDMSEAEGRVYVEEELSAGKWTGKFEFSVSPVYVPEVAAFNLLDMEFEIADATPSNATPVRDDELIEADVADVEEDSIDVGDSEVDAEEEVEESESGENDSTESCSDISEVESVEDAPQEVVADEIMEDEYKVESEIESEDISEIESESIIETEWEAPEETVETEAATEMETEAEAEPETEVEIESEDETESQEQEIEDIQEDGV